MGKDKHEAEDDGREVEVKIEDDGATAAVETEDGSGEEAASAPQKKRSGRGFLLGMLIGAAAGAVAAIAFSPEEEPAEAGAAFSGNGAPEDEDRARSLLGQVRSRLADARDEAREAAREAEERSRARYAELTGDKS